MGSAQGWVYRIFTIQDHPADPDLYLRRARLRREAGRLDEAVEDYRKAAELSQNPSTAIEELARTLLQDGDRARALIELEGSVKKYGADTTGFLRLGKERWMLDDKTSARAIWELGVTLFPENTVLFATSPWLAIMRETMRARHKIIGGPWPAKQSCWGSEPISPGLS